LDRIENKDFRKMAGNIISNLSALYDPTIDKKMNLKDLDDIALYLRKSSKETEKQIKDHFTDDLALSNLGITCIGLLSLTVHHPGSEDELFPEDWLSPSVVNANFSLSHLLGHLSNFGNSIRILIEKGLDAQARTQMRQMLELSWMTLALVYDKELWRGYVSCEQGKENEYWYRNLRVKKLNNKLSEMEASVIDDPVLLNLLKSKRAEAYSDYSDVAHHSFTSVVLGCGAFNKEGNIENGVFGALDFATIPTLEQLNFTLWYFSLCFFSILDKTHGVYPKSPEKDFWLEVLALNFVLKELYIYHGQKES